MKLLPFFLRSLAFSCLFFTTAYTHAQSLDATISTIGSQFQQERVYVHYDKSAYFPGETIWFKAYVMEGLYLAEGSKTLYVDWIDAKGEVLQHSVCPIVEGGTNGQFQVPENFAGTSVQVQAYTKWMLNFDTAFLYSKTIRINQFKSSAAPKVNPVTTLHFFPEGGDAVIGLKNKVAFKATDQWGRPVRIKGIVQGSGGNVVDSLRVQHDGMGYINWVPMAGLTYVAKWQDEKGVMHTTNLPLAKAEGVVLEVAPTGAKRAFSISIPENAPAHLKTLHVVGTMHQNKVFALNVKLATTDNATGLIPTAQLPSGILTITIFDAGWNAIAERILFINNNEALIQPQLNVAHWGLNKRSRNEVELEFPDSIEANLSIAVTDAAIGTDSSHTILSHLLLTSELKGTVHQPSYYFSGLPQAATHIDLVMLTNGWRRFKWDDVVKGKVPTITYPKDTAYLALSGKVVGPSGSQLRDAGEIILIVNRKDSTSMLIANIDKDGRFSDPDFIFFDTLQVYHQFQKAKGFNNANITFMPDRLPAVKYNWNTNKSGSFYGGDTTGEYRHRLLVEERERVSELMKEKMLANVTVKAKIKTPLEVMDEKYTSSGLFQGSNSYQFDLVNDPVSQAALTIFTYLQGRVPGLQIQTDGLNANLLWRDGTPSIFLNEMQVDAETISSIPVSDIAYVKVMRPPFFGATGGGSSGAISIYTRRGDDVKSTPGKGLPRNRITGYTPVKEFYSPNYNTTDPRNEARDVRTTLYWNPMVLTTGKNRKVVFSFFNNDVTGAFRVVVEGVTKDGQLVRLEQLME